jgi:hypothetical protein
MEKEKGLEVQNMSDGFTIGSAPTRPVQNQDILRARSFDENGRDDGRFRNSTRGVYRSQTFICFPGLCKESFPFRPSPS